MSPPERLADAIRRLIDLSVWADVPAGDVDAMVADLESVTARLERLPRRSAKVPHLPDLTDLQASFGTDPVIGGRNPIAPPVELWIDGATVRGRMNLGRPYEGPPGYVHGAVIAAVFDLLCGVANLASGNAGMTGTLTVRYNRPTPLGTDLDLEAGASGSEGRKVFIRAVLRAGDVVTAEADAVFVSLARRHAEEYFPSAGSA